MNNTTQQLQNQTTNPQTSSKNHETSESALSVSNPVTNSKTTRKNQDNHQQINYHAHQCTMVRWGAAAAGGVRERPNHPTTRTTPVDLASEAVSAVRGWVSWC